MNKQTPQIALIGFPNSGKSTLLNKLCEQKIAITANEPHTTRDLNYGEKVWKDMYIQLVDTGGLVVDPQDKVQKQIQIKTWSAIGASDLLLWVFDRRTNPDTISLKILQRIWKLGKPFFILINKADSPSLEKEISEYASLGGQGFFNLSATRGFGVDQVLDLAVDQLLGLGFQKHNYHAPDLGEFDWYPKPKKGKRMSYVKQNKQGEYYIVREGDEEGHNLFRSLDTEELGQLENECLNPIKNLVLDLGDVVFDTKAPYLLSFLKTWCQELAILGKPRQSQDFLEILTRPDFEPLDLITPETGYLSQEPAIDFGLIKKKFKKILRLTRKNAWSMSKDLKPWQEFLRELNFKPSTDPNTKSNVKAGIKSNVESNIKSNTKANTDPNTKPDLNSDSKLNLDISVDTNLDPNLNHDLDLGLTAEDLRQVWVRIDFVNPKVLEFLVEMRSRGVKLYYLSNASQEVAQVRKQDLALQMFEGGLFDCDTDYTKPQLEIYRAFLNKFAIKPRETIFIDNLVQNVQTAREVGMWGVVFDSQKTDLKFELKKIQKDQVKQKPEPSKMIFLGKPNVGKSSLFNAMCAQDLQIITDEPGTTLSVNDFLLKRNYHNKFWLNFSRKYILLDSTGIRKSGQRKLGVETFATYRTIEAAHRAEVVLLVLDASSPVTHQDQVVAGIAKEAKKGLIILANKVDLLDEDQKAEFLKSFKFHFRFLKVDSFIWVSAKDKTNLAKIWDKVDEVLDKRAKNITREELRKLFNYLMKQKPPKKLSTKKRAVIYDLVYEQAEPPTFALLIKDKTSVHWSYVRFLENILRKQFDLQGVGIKLILKEVDRKKNLS
jgi:HAD superfamily hydrolase (TIGR01509 family)